MRTTINIDDDLLERASHLMGPIDRTALPAPIEFLRRHELVEALLHLPAFCW